MELPYDARQQIHLKANEDEYEDYFKGPRQPGSERMAEQIHVKTQGMDFVIIRGYRQLC